MTKKNEKYLNQNHRDQVRLFQHLSLLLQCSALSELYTHFPMNYFLLVYFRGFYGRFVCIFTYTHNNEYKRSMCFICLQPIFMFNYLFVCIQVSHKIGVWCGVCMPEAIWMCIKFNACFANKWKHYHYYCCFVYMCALYFPNNNNNNN